LVGWTGPDFTPSVTVFYYTRVIEIDDPDIFTDINYGFSGFKVGVDLEF
jgi:Protein of unknown function (DUF3604)